jgi:hypothetical protein
VLHDDAAGRRCPLLDGTSYYLSSAIGYPVVEEQDFASGGRGHLEPGHVDWLPALRLSSR